MKNKRLLLCLSILSILILSNCGTTCIEECPDEKIEEGNDYTSSVSSDNSSPTTYAGPGSYCAYNYTKDACDSLCSSYPTGDCSFNEGYGYSSCGNALYDSEYDYDYSESDGFGSIGACTLSYSSSGSNSSDSSPSGSSPSGSSSSDSSSVPLTDFSPNEDSTTDLIITDYSTNNTSDSTDSDSSSSTQYSCWTAPSNCVSTRLTWSEYTEDYLIVKHTNNCSDRVYARFCNERKEGVADCGESGIRVGSTFTWSTYNATGRTFTKYIGVRNPADDWLCAGKQPTWQDSPFD